jgi:heme exporter protein C
VGAFARFSDVTTFCSLCCDHREIAPWPLGFYIIAMHRFANPTRFLRLARFVLPVAGAATLGAFGVGLYLALVGSPPDYQQGESVRIMYVHVPAAWMAMGCYSFIFCASVASIIWKHPLSDIAARAAAPIGASFTAICLVTGSLWGRPTWGAYWAWDARLTSVLILFFIYLGYMALWSMIEERSKAARAAAILAIVGFINVPIIKFSVEWWSSIHQQASVSKLGKSSIHPDMLKPLLVMALAYVCLFITLLIWRMRGEIAAVRMENRLLRREMST